MDDHPEQVQRLGPIELVDERRNRLLAQRRRRRGHVDQIARVRDHRRDARLGNACTKRADVVGPKWRGVPPVGVLREDLQRLAAVDQRAINGLGYAARHRHVRTNAKHGELILNKGGAVRQQAEDATTGDFMAKATLTGNAQWRSRRLSTLRYLT